MKRDDALLPLVNFFKENAVGYLVKFTLVQPCTMVLEVFSSFGRIQSLVSNKPILSSSSNDKRCALTDSY